MQMENVFQISSVGMTISLVIVAAAFYLKVLLKALTSVNIIISSATNLRFDFLCFTSLLLGICVS